MWMPPSSLGNVPILYYVMDVFDAYQAFLLKRENTSNLSYSFNYSVLGITRCFNSYKFQVNVRGINVDGEGNISTLLLDVIQNDTYCITTTISGKNRFIILYHLINKHNVMQKLLSQLTQTLSWKTICCKVRTCMQQL